MVVVMDVVTILRSRSGKNIKFSHEILTSVSILGVK